MSSRTEHRTIRKKRGSNRLFFILLFLIAITTIVLAVEPWGIIRITSLSEDSLPIEGIDVSNHQGNINWNSIDQELVNFVFIKATEGVDFTDKSFAKNWKEARAEGFLCGAYHFYDVESDGKKQADHFIKTVPASRNTLPPVIDIETTGENQQSVIDGLKAYVKAVEKYYNKKPIFYVNQTTYDLYVKDTFAGYPIWFADYSAEPTIEWSFWQFTDSASIVGIGGPVDFNQYSGDKEQLLELID